MKKSQIFVLVLLAILMLSACGGSNTAGSATDDTNNTENSNNFDPIDNSNQGSRFSVDDISFDLGSEEANECANSLPLDFLDEDAVNQSAFDGEEVTLLIQDSFAIEETFCAQEITQQTLDILDEFDALIEEGKTDEALRLIEDYVNQLDAELDAELELIPSGSVPHRAAPALSHDGGAARRYIRQMLSIAAHIQLTEGPSSEEAQEYIDKAKARFIKYGFEELNFLGNEFPDALAALAISAEAQLFGANDTLEPVVVGGLADLNESGQDKAREIFAILLPRAFNAFEPCTATIEDTSYLDKLFAYGMMLKVDFALNNADEYWNEKFRPWEEIQRKRAAGEEVTECANTWEIKMDTTATDANGTVVFHWEGFFQVGEDQKIEGDMSGTLNGDLPNLICFYVEEGQPTQGLNPAIYTGSARIALSGEVVGEGENAKFHLNTTTLPGVWLANSNVEGTYGNENCKSTVTNDFIAGGLRHIMASPMLWIGPLGQGLDYLELPAKAGTNNVSLPLGEAIAVFTIVITQQSDNNN